MSRLRELFERRSAYPPVDTPGKWKQGMAWQPWGSSSQTVTTDQAMRLSAVFACLRLLSEAVATLPVDVYRKEQRRRVAVQTPAWLRFDQVGSDSEIDYLSQVMLSLLTDGNAYVATPRDDLGVPVNLVVLDPCKVEPKRETVGSTVRFEVDNKTFDRFDIMHIRGMTLPGHIKGLSPIGYARETIGLGLAAQGFGQSFFENGALPSAVLEAPGEMSQPAADRFRESWNAGHAGTGNANRVGVLTNGAKLTKVSVQPNDAQFLETRQFQVPDVCRFYGVPPHLVADASNSTSWGSGLAEQNLAFGQFSLRSWVTRIDRAHTRLLPRGQFVKLNLDALLRASLADRYAAHAVGIASRFITVNEARAHEDLEPLPGGDDFAPPATPEPPIGGAA